MEKRWKFATESLKELHKKSGMKVSFKEFKRLAEKFANDLLKEASKKESKDDTVN